MVLRWIFIVLNMKTTEQKIQIIKRWMKRQYKRGENNEFTNSKYRQLLKDSKYYENQFKVKDYDRI
jgi:chorismate mutase